MASLPRSVSGASRRSRQTTARILSLAPQATLVTLLFLTYASYEYGFGRLEPVWPILVALALTVPVLRALGSGSNQLRPPPLLGPTLTTLLLLIAPAALWGTWLGPTRGLPPPAPPLREITVLTYNVHQGFRQDGRLDAEALADTISMSGAQVVILQEVSRGWVVNGSFDLFEWLRHRLGMNGRFAATAGSQWGNAILSRLPMEAVSRQLPSRRLPLARGYQDAIIDLGDGSLRILATHLHHAASGSAVRDRQVAALLEAWGGSPRTVIAGDLNAEPSSPEILRLRRAGLHDASELLPDGQRATYRRHGRTEQIDYVWATPDLVFTNSEVLFSRASDHLPLLTTLRLPDEGEVAGATP